MRRNLAKQQPVTSKDRVNSELYSIGATGKNREGRFSLEQLVYSEKRA